jgi:hypothetical protein
VVVHIILCISATVTVKIAPIQDSYRYASELHITSAAPDDNMRSHPDALSDQPGRCAAQPALLIGAAA